MTPELTIVIPCYNNLGIHDLIADFYRLHDPSMFRLVVVDQTKDGLVFDEKTPVHVHIKVQRNLGFSKAINTGWKLAGTPYTLLANDDVRLLDARWYEDAKAHLTEGVLAVNPFPALRTWDGGGEPKWYHEIHGEKWQWTKDKPFESYTKDDYDLLKEMIGGGNSPGTTMFFTLMKTEARELVGILDEAYWNGGEDYDWNRRCFLTCAKCNKRKSQHLGELFKCSTESPEYFAPYKILTCNNSLVHHECSATKKVAAKEGGTSMYDLVSKNKNIFNEKWSSESEKNPDIYGRSGALEPNTPWAVEVPY